MELTRRAAARVLLVAVALVMPLSSSGGPPERSIQITNATWGPYERMYGEPMMMSVATLIEEMDRGRAPQRQTIRTFGRFYPSIRRKSTISRDPEAPGGSTNPPSKPTGAPRPSTTPVDDSSATNRILFQLCDERDPQQYLTFVPFEEIADRLEADASSYYGQRAVVTGVLEAGVFRIWSFEAGPDAAKRGQDGRDSALRALVAAAGAADKTVVRARGQFRGRNLFGDLPEDTRRGSSDWVIADQGVAVWVSGKAPKGKGWSLDLDSKSESTRWVEVFGQPTARDGVVYLKASSVSLVKGPDAEAGPP